ncbi:hypothetical protein EsH8_I_000295 [Colletotrichum jinshuiense]
MADNVEAEAPHNNFDTILVLDFGSQTSHLILRRLRSLKVYAEMLPCNTKLEDLPFKPKGIVLSGGPSSVYDNGAPHVDPAVFELGVPILGIWYDCRCSSLYAILYANSMSATVARKATLLATRSNFTLAYMSHFDKLVKLPEGFVVVASTKNSEFAGIAHKTKPIYGVQFHPELEHTPRGSEILHNFAVDICGAQANWAMSNFIQNEIVRIRNLVGDHAQVIGAVSGGVDSTVTAKLMTEAIGKFPIGAGVDNGVMRLNECEQVKETLDKHLGINLTVVDGAELFLGRLKGEKSPEAKRKIIGRTFIDLFQQEAARIEKEAAGNQPVEWLVQGTLYPDVTECHHQEHVSRINIHLGQPLTLETAHHNVGGLPDTLKLKLIEPLRELFKDECRAFGQELGIDRSLVMRHPFPGPGIAIRILGEVTPERVAIARAADHIFISEIKAAGVYDEISQAYVAISQDRAVGVQGDARVYGYIAILRAVKTLDYMSAEPYEFDFSFIKRVSTRIVNEVDGIARVTYDITSKPPGTIEME